MGQGARQVFSGFQGLQAELILGKGSPWGFAIWQSNCEKRNKSQVFC